MRRFRRDKDHRKALLVNLTKNLIKHKAIKTTLPKAKDLRSFVEPILTRSKVDSLHNRKIIASQLMNDWSIVDILFKEIGTKIQTRQGGYTRIIKAGVRKGDGSKVGFIELVDLAKSSKEPQIKKKIEDNVEESNEAIVKTSETLDVTVE